MFDMMDDNKPLRKHVDIFAAVIPTPGFDAGVSTKD